MKTLVISPHTRKFLWETEFSYHTFKKYSLLNREGIKDDFLCLLIDGNHPNSEIEAPDYEPTFPYHKVLPFHKYFGSSEEGLGPEAAPINIATGIKQWLDSSDYEGTIQIIDPDCIFISACSENIEHDQDFSYCFVDDIYNDWHLKVRDKNGDVAEWVSQRYLPENAHLCRGGFVPIILHSNVLREIIDSWIEINLQILRDDVLKKEEVWWANMYAFDFACAKHGVRQIPRNMATIPGLYEIKQDQVLGHVIHYSIFPIGTFNKRSFISDFRYHGSSYVQHLPEFNNATKRFKEEFTDFVQNFRLIGNIF